MEQCLLLRRDFTYAVKTVRVVTENLIKICGSGEIALSWRKQGFESPRERQPFQ